MPQFWSGHYDSVWNVLDKTLQVISSLCIPEAVEAAGLMTQLQHHDFLPVSQITRESGVFDTS